MSNKKTYKVYIHTTPDGMVYVGVTGQDIKERWRPILYKGMSLYPYIEQYGWEAIKHEVIYTCEDKDEAYQVEEEMRKYYEEKGCCINKNRSGLIKKDEKAYRQQYIPDYNRQWQQDHRKERAAYMRQKYQNNPEYREKKNERSRQYYQDHKEERNAYDRKYRAKKKAESEK